MKNKNSMKYLAISNLFLVFLGVGLVIPVIPQIKETMNFSGATMGMMVSIYAIAQLLASPLTGILSDKVGRKKIIAAGMIVFSISELIFGLAQTKNGFFFFTCFRWFCGCFSYARSYGLCRRYHYN